MSAPAPSDVRAWLIGLTWQGRDFIRLMYEDDMEDIDDDCVMLTSSQLRCIAPLLERFLREWF